MKRIFTLLLGLIVIGQATAQDKVEFIMEDWHTAVAQAQEEGKYLMLDAYTEWCYWCKVQDAKTFGDPDMAAYIHENFIPLKVDMEKGIGIELAAKFRVSSYPQLLIFNPQGQYVYNIGGYVESHEKFKGRLMEALAITDERVYAYDSQELNPGFPQWYIDTYDPEKRRSRPEREVITEFMANQDDLFSEVAWAIMVRFGPSEEQQAYVLENSEKYIELYGSGEFEGMIEHIVRTAAQKATEAGDIELLTATFPLIDEYLPAENAPFYKEYFTSNFYKLTEDWRGYTKIALDKIEREGVEASISMLNSVGWTLFLDCEDPECLKKASDWMKEVVELAPEYAYLDTYAALLFKTGEYVAAEKEAERAIQIGSDNGEDVSSTEELLEEIRSAMADGDD